MEGNRAKAATYAYVPYIETTPENVWRTLVDSEITRRYWLHDHVSDWKPGSHWEHRRADNSGTVDITGKVLESVAPRASL